MLYLTKEDLKTHIYAEQVDEITREDDAIADEAIETAVAEAKGYMSRFDLLKLFGTDVVAPVIIDKNLKAKVKDLVRWYLVKLGSPNIDYNAAKESFEHAIEYYFQRVQAGKITPDGWPYKPDTTQELPSGTTIHVSSNTKRINHY